MITLIGSAYWDVLFSVDEIPKRLGGHTRAVLHNGNPGGCVPNTAARIASLGLPVTLVTRVGDDSSGDQYRAACAQVKHLSVLWLPVREATNLSIVLITPDGERTLISAVAPREEREVTIDFTPELELQLQRTALLWVGQSDPELRWRYASQCPGERGLPAQHFAIEAQAGHQWDYVVGSLDDASPPSREQLHSSKVKLCVMTAGAEGCHYSEAGGPWQEFRVQPAAQIVDTCGAGDAFLGGLLAGLAGKLPTHSTLALGARCGADAVGHHGSWPPSASA